ncbi:sigma-54 dependent transcriptional regulator [bacterium]|nr:sigma-54 dependent transcriptional regulator [bacterium]
MTLPESNILIIDDDRTFCDMLALHLSYLNHKVTFALSLKEGLNKLNQVDFEVIYLDVRLPDGNGLLAIPVIKESRNSPEIIIVTGEGDPDGAELAINNGAWDYIEKPSSINEMTLPLIRALEYRKEKSQQRAAFNLDREEIVGSSSQIKACLDLVAEAAASDINVLISGETGTGKEVFTRVIHNNLRKSSALVTVDCAALPENLVESTLFGHVKGSFTGAIESTEGLIKQADGGTLFLDEIGELPLRLQKALLRVLQEHTFRPVGSKREEVSNFKLIAATNRNLQEMVNLGTFREDLFFRLKSLSIHLPPLRERSEDIKELVALFITKHCEAHKMDTKGYTPEFIKTLVSYNWPGNVRELKNAVETALNRAGRANTLFDIHLPVNIRSFVTRKSIRKEPSSEKSDPLSHFSTEQFPSFQEYRDEILENAEKQYLQNLLSIAEHNTKKALDISGLSRSWFYELLKKHGISNH